MAFRIPISVMVNMTHLRSQHSVITASEYLHLHGLDPGFESGNGIWLRDRYHVHPSVFETNKTKTPSLFIIENHWYDPVGINRVNYITEAMKLRGNLERHLSSETYNCSAEYWPPLEPTELSRAGCRLAWEQFYYGLERGQKCFEVVRPGRRSATE